LRFWDSSALVPLLVEEEVTVALRALYLSEPVDAVLETARRLLRVHLLRAADSLQLAAAFLASEGRPKTLELVCLDDRLGTAAEREGFRVLDRSHL
jgi:hypothetical protein